MHSHGPRLRITMSWLKYVIKSVTRLSDGFLEVCCQPTFAPPGRFPYEKRPSVILGLLAGYDAKPIDVSLGRDRVVSEHVLYLTHRSI
ncbi:hypothetical protein CsSME_00032073 [Camellia sinensis var. sinensis]